METAEEGIWLAKPDGLTLFVNKKMADVLGYTQEEIVGQFGIEYLKDVDFQEVEKVRRELHQNKRICGEYVFHKKDGTVVKTLGKVSPIFDESGQHIANLAMHTDITERKKTEEVLAYKANLLSQVHEAVVGLDRNLNVLFWNKAGEAMFGWKEEEIIGKDGRRFIKEKFNECIQEEIFTKLIETGRWTGEASFINKDGKNFCAEVNASTIRDANRKITGIVVIIRDVTERKKAEEALKRSEQRTTDILTSIDDYAYSLDKNWNFIFVSNKVAKDFERKPEQLIGKNFWDTFPNFKGTQVEVNFRKTMNKRVKTRFEWKTIYAFGYRDFTVYPSAEGVTVFGKDITESKLLQRQIEEHSKNLEQLVKERTAKIAKERERLFDVLEALPVMICLLTPDHHVTFANRRFRERFGESEGRHCYEFCFGNREPCSFCESYKVLKTGKPHHWQVTDSDGSAIDAYVYPFTDTDGSPLILEMDLDITEYNKMQKQLQDQERLVAIGQTAGMVGHDIRNPLQAMTSDVYLLKSDFETMPECNEKEGIGESLASLEKNIAYINKIVADLQDYAKSLKPELNPVDVSELIEDTIKNIDVPENIAVSIQVKGIPKLKTDQTFIRRILTNLVNNAIQAMSNGGKLTVEGFVREVKVVITVSDTGVGIPAEVKSKLFTPMLTTKAKGQGLGLAVVKRLVEALAGTITFESELGKGTKFVIELPFQN